MQFHRRACRVLCVQCSHGFVPSNDDIQKWKESRPDVIIFPEYFRAGPQHKNIAEFSQDSCKIESEIAVVSREMGECLIVGGSVPIESEGIYFNTCLLYQNGNLCGKYRKMNPVSFEREVGVQEGDEIGIIHVTLPQIGELKIGIMICADVFLTDLFTKFGERNVDFIVIPTSSPFRESETRDAKIARDVNIFVNGASLSKCPVIKVCSVGELFGKRVQGRTLVATPSAISHRVPFDKEFDEDLLLVEL